MAEKLYTRKIKYCMYCPDYAMERIPGKRHSGTICRKTRIYIATETRDAPTPDQEKDVFKKWASKFPSFCPLEDCE